VRAASTCEAAPPAIGRASPRREARRLRRRGAVDALPLDDELVLFDTQTSTAFAANATGSVIWTLCDGTRGADGIAIELVARYGITHDQAAADVRHFLELASDAGLLDVTP